MKNYLDQHVRAYQGNNIYDFDNEIMLNWYPHRVIAHSRRKESMLELGLGHGYTTNIFSKYFEKYIVIDGSKAVIDNYKTRFPQSNVLVVESYFEDYYTDESFDVINFGFILEHIDDPVSILKQYRKYLKPGGQIFVAVPNAEVMNRRLGFIAGDLKEITMMSDHDLLLGHKRYYTLHTLISDIQNAGYSVVRKEGIYLKPLSTSQMISLNLQEKYINALCELGIHYPELSCGILVEAE